MLSQLSEPNKNNSTHESTNYYKATKAQATNRNLLAVFRMATMAPGPAPTGWDQVPNFPHMM